jgi:hypothetical protein
MWYLTPIYSRPGGGGQSIFLHSLIQLFFVLFEMCYFSLNLIVFQLLGNQFCIQSDMIDIVSLNNLVSKLTGYMLEEQNFSFHRHLALGLSSLLCDGQVID